MKVTLGDICKFQSGGTPSKKNGTFYHGSIPWITTVALNGGFIDENDAIEWITEKAINESAAKIVPNNSIMVGTRVGVGKVAINRVEMSTSQDIISLIEIDNSLWNKPFLCKYLQSKEKYLNLQARGATIKGIKIETLAGLELPEYDLKTQQHISNSLDNVLSIIKLRKEQLQKLDDLIKARFVEMFGDTVENPKGYRVDTLQTLIDAGDITYHLDGNHGGDYPKSEEFVADGIPYIGANCISNGKIDFTLAKYLTEERAGQLRKGIAQNDDVLFAHNATVGPTVVLHTEEPKVILSTSLTAYRCNKNSIMPEYLATYMKSDSFVMQYSSEMKQTTRNQVPITAQKKYRFLVPPIDEQKTFSDFVHQVDKSKAVVQKALDETLLLFDSLMQEYFG